MNNKKMVSIQKRIIKLIVISVAVISALTILIDITLVNNYATDNAKNTLEYYCNSQTLKIDNQLKMIEKSVSDLVMISEIERPEIESFSDIEILSPYIKKMRKIAMGVANNTEGATAVYYRINPKLNSSESAGFLCTWSPISEAFTVCPPVDIAAYGADDIAHAGWYYLPAKSKESLWMQPYFNRNTNMLTISYAVPIYEGKKLIGVIGMDIDFSQLVNEIAASGKIYESGFSDIISLENKTIYQADADQNGEIEEVPFPDELYKTISADVKSLDMLSYSYNGTEYRYSYNTTESGLVVLVRAPAGEIYSLRDRMLWQSTLITIAVLLGILFVAIRTTQRITAPLHDIIDATQRFAEGDWEFELNCHTNDELEVLTESILAMAENTKTYIADINDMAYTDGLTRLKNKARYMEYVTAIKRRLFFKENVKLAIVCLDLNNLKYVNDNLGHDAGDALIKKASSIVCRRFSHSAVFRFGGDEFFVIMETDDYRNRDAIMEDFQREMREASERDDDSVVIASGMASMPDDATDYDKAFKIADERMYQNKVELKKGKEIR